MASKCLKEVKLMRKSFMRGRYFGRLVHQTSTEVGNVVERAPVKAMFLSMPYFELMKMKSEESDTREMRPANIHPVRSLLEYSNILAIDSERDRHQAITKLDSNRYFDSDEFIHVPEFWALVINMCKG